LKCIISGTISGAIENFVDFPVVFDMKKDFIETEGQGRKPRLTQSILSISRLVTSYYNNLEFGGYQVFFQNVQKCKAKNLCKTSARGMPS
jgi:hypothetical protein